jgi:hypothetical protein
MYLECYGKGSPTVVSGGGVPSQGAAPDLLVASSPRCEYLSLWLDHEVDALSYLCIHTLALDLGKNSVSGLEWERSGFYTSAAGRFAVQLSPHHTGR